MPTFAELAGVPAPARTDGRSLVPTLTGRGAQRMPTVYSEYFVAGRTPAYPEFEPSRRNQLRRQMQVLRMGDYMGVRYNVTNHAAEFQMSYATGMANIQKGLDRIEKFCAQLAAR